MPGFADRLKFAINVLANRIEPDNGDYYVSSGGVVNHRVYRTAAEAVLAPIVTRISIDAANIPMRHVTVDEDGFYVENRKSELNNRLQVAANIDQTGVAFMQDVISTILEEGVCAIVPVEVTTNPAVSTTYDILQLRTGSVRGWYTKTVELEVYNERIGDRSVIKLPKTYVALVYNPLYRIMNEPNSTLKRLQDKLVLLDIADNAANSPNLDLILQLPYVVKNTKREDEATARRTLLENQLRDSRYGIAYIDATEKITQLNRPVANNLIDQVQYLTDSLYSQLGLTPKMFSGEASPEEILAYYNRTLEPILNAIAGAMKKSFLTQTAISQGQDIKVFPDIFKMAPIDALAEAADKFTRNEIMSSNEFRSVLGLRPRENPEADELRNKNLNREAQNGTQPKSDELNEKSKEKV